MMKITKAEMAELSELRRLGGATYCAHCGLSSRTSRLIALGLASQTRKFGGIHVEPTGRYALEDRG